MLASLMNLGLLIIKGALDLVASKKGYSSLRGSSGPHFKHHFLDLREWLPAQSTAETGHAGN